MPTLATLLLVESCTDIYPLAPALVDEQRRDNVKVYIELIENLTCLKKYDSDRFAFS